MNTIEIKNRYDGNVLFSAESESLKSVVELAVRQGADLGGANLRGAYLRSAYLRSANLGGAYLRGADLGNAYLKSANLRGADLGGANLRGAYLRSAYLRSANLGGAYLRGADLGNAYLRGADLGNAYLRGANLGGAKIVDDITIYKIPTQILGGHWDIMIFDLHMKIGCEFHSLTDWFNFSDERINSMDPQALLFWRKWKDLLRAICVSDGRYAVSKLLEEE